jgi:hypothetical protein
LIKFRNTGFTIPYILQNTGIAIPYVLNLFFKHTN